MQTVIVKNNLFDSVETAVSVFNDATVSLTSDYNLFYGDSLSMAFNWSPTNSSIFDTIAHWQGLGHDLNATSGNPNLNAQYIPRAERGHRDSRRPLSAGLSHD